jgi:hypothetical protein
MYRLYIAINDQKKTFSLNYVLGMTIDMAKPANIVQNIDGPGIASGLYRRR